MMDIYEQMIYYVRSIQYLDFLQHLKNKKFKYVPHFKKGADLKYTFIHSYKKMLKKSQIEDFEDRNIEIMYRVTRNLIWPFDRILMDYQKSFIENKTDRIAAKQFQIDIYNNHLIKYLEKDEVDTYHEFKEKLNTMKKAVKSMDKKDRYEFIKNSIREIDALFKDIEKVTENKFKNTLRNMRRDKRSFLKRYEDIIEDYSNKKIAEEEGNYRLILKQLPNEDVAIEFFTSLIENYNRKVNERHLDEKLCNTYKQLLNIYTIILDRYRQFKKDDIEISAASGSEKIDKITKIQEKYSDEILNEKSSTESIMYAIHQAYVNKIMDIKNKTVL